MNKKKVLKIIGCSSVALLLLVSFPFPVWCRPLEDTARQGNNVYALLTPLALFFVLLELAADLITRKGRISFQEAVANMGTALGNQTVNVLIAAGVYHVYGGLWNHYRLMDIPLNFWSGLALLVSMDFIFYWVHRWGHKINILWAAHSPHHSAEEMNFFVALRASVTQRLVSFLFFWPLTIIGFRPMDIYVMSALHLFIAFLHHTEYVGKLWRWIEFIFTTPSHHRVHHGINFKYLDKNYSEFLIIWDRLFGTFQEEQEKVVYGMYNGPRTWNPILINFHYFIMLWKDALAAPYLWDKIRVWFMPTGWRPRGLPQKKLEEITAENQTKYRSQPFRGAKPYLVIQVIFGLVLVLLVIREDSPWTPIQRWVGAGLLWWAIINWSGILESRTWLLPSEIARLIFTSGAFTVFFSWHLMPQAETVLFYLYGALSLIWAVVFFQLQAFSPHKENMMKPA
jgi:sterol desaturase/sphingolipid hydroxylase (fatty acid hydroxylase superfamily)